MTYLIFRNKKRNKTYRMKIKIRCRNIQVHLLKYKTFIKGTINVKNTIVIVIVKKGETRTFL